MWEIEAGAEWADLQGAEFNFYDSLVEWLRITVNMFYEQRLIFDTEGTDAMEWVRGVVIDDEDVRVPAHFGGLTVAITRRS